MTTSFLENKKSVLLTANEPAGKDSLSSILSRLQQYAPTEPKPEAGLLKSWGIQPLWDNFIGRHYFEKIALSVPHTFVPILKLCADDRKEIDIL